MKAYLITTASLFGLLVGVHVWRVVEEGAGAATDHWVVGSTLLSLGMCIWAVRLLWASKRT